MSGRSRQKADWQWGVAWVAMLVAPVLAQAQHGQGQFEEFSLSSLPPIPDRYREITDADVKRFWLGQIPQLHPPARSSPGYAYDMPHYRRRLEARNRLVDAIKRGMTDEKAACEALRHNLRYFRNRGNRVKVRELEREQLRREAMHRGDLKAILMLEDRDERDLQSETRRQLEQQADLIQELRGEIEALRRQLAD